MRAHAHDLRAEVATSFDITDDAQADAFVHEIARDGDSPRLGAADRALCAYADKLTRTPAEVGADDVQALRAEGLSDEAVHEAVQVIGYFNYINRVADGLGVELEDFIRPWER